MFRRLREAVTRLSVRTRTGATGPDDRHLAREVRTPDPYVWRLPSPYEARWRRWSRRSWACGRRLPFPREETCWQQTPDHPLPPAWETDEDVVRAYVLRP